MQAVPRRGVGSRHCCGLLGGDVVRQGCRQSRVTGDECSPRDSVGNGADPVADVKVGHPGSHRSHDTREVDPEARSRALYGVIPAEGEQYVGEIDTGSTDCHFDLARRRRLPVSRDELQGVQVARNADVEPHAVLGGIDDGGSPLTRAQRTLAQPGGVPRAVPPRRLVLVGSADQFTCDPVRLGVGIDIDLGRSKSGVFGTDHPQQAAHSAVVETDPVILGHRLRVPGDHIESRRLTLDVRQLLPDTDDGCD